MKKIVGKLVDDSNNVCFYGSEFYCLSNFSSFQMWWPKKRVRFSSSDNNDCVHFATAEHVYHWEKFATSYKPGESVHNSILEIIKEAVFNAKSAHDAFKIAEKYKAFVSPDWTEGLGKSDDGNIFKQKRVAIMRKILYQKAKQHEYVAKKLMETGNRHIIEDSWRDDFWGWGPDCNGQNVLGCLWEDVRDIFKNGIATSEYRRLDHVTEAP